MHRIIRILVPLLSAAAVSAAASNFTVPASSDTTLNLEQAGDVYGAYPTIITIGAENHDSYGLVASISGGSPGKPCSATPSSTCI